MADAGVSFLLENLQDLLAERTDLIQGVEGEVQQLQKELQLLELRLLRPCLAEPQKKEKDLIQFDREIRDAVYKAEDVIDSFLTRAEAKNSTRFLLKNLNLRSGRFLPEILKTDPVSCARYSRHRLTFKEHDLPSVTDGVRNALKQVTPATKGQLPETEIEELVHLHLQTDGVGNALKQATPAAIGQLPEIELKEIEHLHLQTDGVGNALKQATPATGQLLEIDELQVLVLLRQTHGTSIVSKRATPAAKGQLPKIKLELENLHLQTHGTRNALIQATPAAGQLPEIKLEEILGLERNNLVVGFEDELETLVGYLNQESKKLDVISIVGDYGSGKTTLASMIYKDPKIKSSFPTLWVNVSQEFSTKSLFLAITNGSDQKTIAQLTDSMLADIVRHNLDGKKFLMIVDGVHTTQDWMAIEATLPKANGFGKVVITTHDEKLACRANPKGNTLRLRPLNGDESWQLFLKVFGKLGDNGECPSDLKMIEEDIANKCKGSPLAIVTMAAEFGRTREKGEWENISKSVDMHLRKVSERRMGNIIRMSYDKLPYHLRDCFLYLGMFPEDTEIPAWKFVYLWIAEGFIKRNPRKRLEEAAEDQLEDLIDRNLVMVDKKKVGGGVKTCRISKMVREFICRMQAEVSAEEKIFQEVHDVSEISTFRRLCINSNVVDFLRKKPYGANVRSFLYFSNDSTDLPPECTDSILQAFSLLRILDAGPIKFLEFSRKLAQLIHLRYIAISGDELNTLPQSVSNLWNLQTIIITTASRTLTFEGNIWKMMRLRHLKTKAAIVISEVAKGKAGENLQTFTRLAAQCVTEDFCSRASNLKILGIRGQLNTLLERSCLERLDRLQKLKLVHDVFPAINQERPLIRLPPREAFPPNLMILELSSTFLTWNHMATLALLPTLEVLKLKENACVGRYWIADHISFPYLEVLLIASTNLEIWIASSDSFPKLRSLVLKNCDHLGEFPHDLVETLHVLDIDRCNKHLVSIAKGIEKEKQQMKDLPSDAFKLTFSE